MGLEAYLIPDNKVTQEEQIDRLSICEACAGFNPKTRTCGKAIVGGYAYSSILQKRIRLCGCFLDKKTMFKTEKCPAGKW